MGYGITGYGLMVSLSSLLKSEFLKLIILIFSNFFRSNSLIFEPKVEKNIYGCFFHSFDATDLKLGTNNDIRMK